MSWPNLYQLSDTNDSNLRVTHSVTQGYYSFSLRHFDPLPGHDLFRSLPPITPSSNCCVPVFFFFVLSNLAPSCHISSSHLFLGFPEDLLPPGLPSKFRFRIAIDYPYYMPSPMWTFNMYIPVQRPYTIRTYFRCTVVSRRHQSLLVRMFSEWHFSKKPVIYAVRWGSDRVWGYYGG